MLHAQDVDERNRIIGENLRKYRLLKGLTQDELAEGICSISQLSKVENGKTYIKRSLLKQMAERLSITVERIESTDALLEELTETLQLAKDALTANNLDKSYQLVRDVINKGREFGYVGHLIEGVLLECRILMHQQRYEDVIKIATSALEEELHQDSTQKVRLLSELGYAHQLYGNMMAAYDYYTRADEEFEQHEGNHETRLKIFHELARCNALMQNYRTALRYIEKAERLAKEHSIHLRRIRASYVKADFLERLGESNKAEEIYLATLKEAEDNSFLLDVAIINHNMGCLFQNRGDFGQAIMHFQRAQKLFELLNEGLYACQTLLHYAEIAHEEEDFDKSIDYIEQILDTIDEYKINTYREKAQALRILAKIKYTQGNFDEYVSHMEDALLIYEQNHVMMEAYNISTDLAEALYQKGDSRSLEMFRKAIEYNKKNMKFGLRR